MRSWRTAIRVLRQYRSFSPSVRKSIAALEILFQRLPTQELHHLRNAGETSNMTETQPGNVQTAVDTGSLQREPHGSGLRQYESQPISSTEDIGMGTDVNETMTFDGSDHLSTDENFTFSLDPFDLNISFDITDLSWLNTLPYSF